MKRPGSVEKLIRHEAKLEFLTILTRLPENISKTEPMVLIKAVKAFYIKYFTVLLDQSLNELLNSIEGILFTIINNKSYTLKYNFLRVRNFAYKKKFFFSYINFPKSRIYAGRPGFVLKFIQFCTIAVREKVREEPRYLR